MIFIWIAKKRNRSEYGIHIADIIVECRSRMLLYDVAESVPRWLRSPRRQACRSLVSPLPDGTPVLVCWTRQVPLLQKAATTYCRSQRVTTGSRVRQKRTKNKRKTTEARDEKRNTITRAIVTIEEIEEIKSRVSSSLYLTKTIFSETCRTWFSLYYTSITLLKIVPRI